jgi:hypothetical protein
MANGPSVKSLVLIAAVAVVAGVVGSYLWQQPGAVAVLGGGPPTPIIEFPKDEVVPAPVLEFKWRGAADLTRVVVIDLADPKKPIIDRVVAGDKYAPIDEERSAFVSGRQYHWFVESQIEGGTRSSTAAQFTMR